LSSLLPPFLAPSPSTAFFLPCFSSLISLSSSGCQHPPRPSKHTQIQGRTPIMMAVNYILYMDITKFRPRDINRRLRLHSPSRLSCYAPSPSVVIGTIPILAQFHALAVK
jgi:hypothetical protein